MADISDVNVSEIKDLYQNLENLSCMSKDLLRSVLRMANA